MGHSRAAIAALAAVCACAVLRGQQTELSIATETVPEGIVGNPYAAVFTALGGVQPYTWQVYSGNIGGMTLDVDTGRLSGIPNTAASVELTVQVEDLFGVAAQRTVTIPIRAEGPLEMVSSDLAAAVSGEPYAAAFRAAGGSAPYRWRVKSGSLPPGVNLDVFGDLQGMPNDRGVFAFTVEVSDALGTVRQRDFELTVGPGVGPRVAPNEGSGSSAVFTLTYDQPTGEMLLLLLNSTQSGSGACWVYYHRPTDTIRLINDADDGWLGPVAPGGEALANGQCVLKRVERESLEDRLVLTLAVQFTPSFAGLKSLWLYTEETGWQLRGSWTAPQIP